MIDALQPGQETVDEVGESVPAAFLALSTPEEMAESIGILIDCGAIDISQYVNATENGDFSVFHEDRLSTTFKACVETLLRSPSANELATRPEAPDLALPHEPI